MVLFLSKEYLDGNLTFLSMLPTQFIPHFFEAEYYGLRNTIFWGSKDLASELWQGDGDTNILSWSLPSYI
jgi:hypothetical protein